MSQNFDEHPWENFLMFCKESQLIVGFFFLFEFRRKNSMAGLKKTLENVRTQRKILGKKLDEFVKIKSTVNG